jgi:fatty acid desaturase
MTHTPTGLPLQTVARRLRVPLRSLFRGFDDVRRYTWQSGWSLIALYALLAAALAGVLPPWVLAVVVPPLYVRSALNVHELMHVRSERQVPWLHRLMMALESPLCLGYREHRDIHLRHHRHCATEDDPEFFQIRGGHLRAFGAAMISPEWMFVDYVRDKGMSRVLLGEAAVRCLLFVAALAVNPAAFAWYWAALRVSIGVSQYAFHHALHQRDGQFGTYALHLPAPVERVLRLAVGAECVHILVEHPAHHAWQVVKPDQLPAVAATLLGGDDAADHAQRTLGSGGSGAALMT